MGGGNVSMGGGGMVDGGGMGGCDAITEPVPDLLLLPSNCGIAAITGGSPGDWCCRLRLAGGRAGRGS